jgi:hypothetical protein
MHVVTMHAVWSTAADRCMLHTTIYLQSYTEAKLKPSWHDVVMPITHDAAATSRLHLSLTRCMVAVAGRWPETAGTCLRVPKVHMQHTIQDAESPSSPAWRNKQQQQCGAHSVRHLLLQRSQGTASADACVATVKLFHCMHTCTCCTMMNTYHATAAATVRTTQG